MALSPQQHAVVMHDFKLHALVLAVAGSGKSFTMVERIAYLVEAIRVDPTKIVAVMFNKKAADEMLSKLQRRMGKRNAPESYTFHGLGTRTLKRLIQGGFAEPWAFEANTHKATKFAAEVIESACRKYGHKYPRLVAKEFLSFIDRVKSDLETPEAVWEKGNWPARYEWFVPWYNQFERERRGKRIRFFSDLIYDPVQVMLNNPAAASYIEGRYEHVILDEYQDICESQQSLIRFTAGRTAIVMSVGDDDQTIYGWRGAKSDYILRDFHRDFPGGTTYKLNRTWRYGHALSCAANYVISGNTDRADKLCISSSKAPNTELFLEYEGLQNGKPKIVSIVDQWLKNGGQLEEMVVLVRSYSKSAESQFHLLQHGIPFRLEGGDEASVLENKWVASLIGWMQLAAGQVAINPYAGDPDIGSIVGVRKIIDVPSLDVGWEKSGILAKLVLQHPEEGQGFGNFVSAHVASQNQQMSDRVLKRGKLWRKLRHMGKAREYPKAVILLNELMYFLDIEKHVTKEANKDEEAEEILSLIEAFIEYVKLNSKGKSLPEFMNHIQDLLTFSEKAKESTVALLITSIHRSKGMEWPCVIMPSLYQGAFPIVPRSINEANIETHLADERRLFYVGMTRAIWRLYMIAPRDPQLDEWLRACKGGNCNDVIPFAKNRSVASQFLYESNLYLSKALPAILAGGRGRESLKASSPELLNRYLKELGVDFEVPKIA
ncbi:ATP-dependent helicase [Pseudomonas veronii]|uniref:ATP-dependent helicase n=1 Tax=Pseudomonas veronii TaxID=76761 RepID=UPI0015A20E64|nr:ATP-dependent helicase [Pseudomonas veronii]